MLPKISHIYISRDITEFNLTLGTFSQAFIVPSGWVELSQTKSTLSIRARGARSDFTDPFFYDGFGYFLQCWCLHILIMSPKLHLHYTYTVWLLISIEIIRSTYYLISAWSIYEYEKAILVLKSSTKQHIRDRL